MTTIKPQSFIERLARAHPEGCFEITIKGKAVAHTDPQRAGAVAEPDLPSAEPLIFYVPAPAPAPPPKAPDQRPHAEPDDHDGNPMGHRSRTRLPSARDR